MSELRLGGLLVDTIGQLKVGSSNVQKAYVGSVQVFPASSTTTTSTTSTTTTTLIPTTTTTSTTSTTTTTLIPTTTTTSTTTSTTTPIPTTTTTTSTTTSTTTEAPTTTTSTTTTTTTSACTSYTVFDVPDASSSTFTYQDCSTLETVSVTISDGGDEVTFCAITGTISVVSGNVTIVDNGPCIPTTTTTTTTAAPTSVTIFWNTSEVGSGGVRLVIYDSTSTPIVDEESSGAGPTNGSVTTSNTPFTVAVSRIAGTEVAQYRICNDSTSTEITHNYSVTSEVTYVVDPTPLTTTIFATYGDSNTPSNCSVE